MNETYLSVYLWVYLSCLSILSICIVLSYLSWVGEREKSGPGVFVYLFIGAVRERKNVPWWVYIVYAKRGSSRRKGRKGRKEGNRCKVAGKSLDVIYLP